MRLDWGKIGEKKFETGVSNGVLYPMTNGAYPKGVVWNGLSGVTESPSGAEAKALYADNGKYLSLTSTEEFGGTIAAYMYPDEFAELNGEAEVAEGVVVGQQKRGIFGLSYRTILGNDTLKEEYGYKLHLVYGAQVSPSEKAYATKNDSPDAINMSWKFTTTPVNVTGKDQTATLTMDSTKLPAATMTAIENILYGSESSEARLPLPDEVIALCAGSGPDALTMTISPIDDALTAPVSSSVVVTFNNKISTESVIVTKADGSIVNGTKSFDTTGKILTFKPASNLSSGTTYIVTIGGVTDVFGQALSAAATNFTTA